MLTVTEAIHWLGLDFPANAGNRLYWPFLISALVIGLAYQHWHKLPSFLTKAIWWHPSARQDYALFMLVNIFKLSVLSVTLPEIGQFIWWGLMRWQDWLGYQSKQPASIEINIAFTICLFVANDFSRYWLHRWMHTSRWLWPIHRLHHTAQVLTPITFYRIHPLESLLFGLRYGLVTGLVTSIYMYWFGFGLHAYQWLGSLVFVGLANMVGSNLRHSQLPLTYWTWLQYWLISPAQHQWHHTVAGNKHNFGSILALWDRLFGSLHNTTYSSKFRFGIEPEPKPENLIRQLLLLAPKDH